VTDKEKRVTCPECGAYVKSSNLESHMKEVHKTKLKKESKSAVSEGKGKQGTSNVSTVGFPWRWVGVGLVVFIIILAVLIIKPIDFGNNPNGTVPVECIDGKTLQVNFQVTLHIMVTDYRTGKVNYTHMIPNGIGTAPINDKACTRRLHTDYDYTPGSQPAKIKVQSPDIRDFTLGDFFGVWDNQTLEPDKVMTYWTPEWRIVFKVNGITVDDTGTSPPYHYETYRLTPNLDIEFYIIYEG